MHLAHESFKIKRMFPNNLHLDYPYGALLRSKAVSASSFLTFLLLHPHLFRREPGSGRSLVKLELCAGFQQNAQGGSVVMLKKQPRLKERLGHFCMKVFTLEIKLYWGFLVSPPPPTPWEVSKSYCGDRCTQKAVSDSALHREVLQPPSAPGSPGTLCTWGRMQCTQGNAVPVGGWASSGGHWLPAPAPPTDILPSLASFGSTAEHEFQTSGLDSWRVVFVYVYVFSKVFLKVTLEMLPVCPWILAYS